VKRRKGLLDEEKFLPPLPEQLPRGVSSLPGYGQTSPVAQGLLGFTGRNPTYSVMDPQAQQMSDAYRLGEQASVASQLYGSVLPFAAASAASKVGALPGAAVYRKSTPSAPDPSVGTRFEREFLGGLVEKKPINLEDYRGASLMIMPWDSTSRNYRITSVSDELLPRPVVTHGGFDYTRDVKHVAENIAGASNLGIAKRIRDRDAIARQENIEAGGTGEILHAPITMGAGAENFSVQPTEVLLGLIDRSNVPKSVIDDLDNEIRNLKIFKGTGEKRRALQPFKNFRGVMTEEGRVQLYRGGDNLESTEGELRKALVDRMSQKKFQEQFGFNAEDVSAAITSPSLAGVPKGYVGESLFLTDPAGGMHLRPSKNPTYNTDFTGEYQGTLGLNLPVEVLMPRVYQRLAQEQAGKTGDIRNMAIGAMEKRKEGVSEIIDDYVLEQYDKYLRQQKRLGLL
jgi:hypothetical protein